MFYGHDRLFAYVRLSSDSDKAQEGKVAALERAGQPVVRILVGDVYDLGQEFFAGKSPRPLPDPSLASTLQPARRRSQQVATRSLTTEYEKTGSLPAESRFWKTAAITAVYRFQNAEALAKAAGQRQSLVGYLRAHIKRAGAGDYFALLAYIQMNAEHETLLQQLRHALRDQKRVPTCLEFGPRFLHSTGQAYKGGPNSGVILQVHLRRAADLPVPGQKYTSESSKLRRPGATFRCSPSAVAGRCACIWAKTSRPAWPNCRRRSIKRWTNLPPGILQLVKLEPRQ